MKVIFLDIDGVLNEEKSRSRCCGYKGIDDKKVENLTKIVKQTNAEIVLISTWKDDWRKTDKAHQGMMANYLDRKLKKQGLRVYDKTESVDKASGMHFSRGESILQYLRKNKVKEFVILDDYQFDYDACGLTDYHVKTDAYNGGLTEGLTIKAIELLNGGGRYEMNKHFETHEGWKNDMGKRCSMCNNPLDEWDLQEDFSFSRWIGYGSKYDLNKLDIQLCCDCFDKVLDFVLPKCKNKILQEYDIRSENGHLQAYLVEGR